MKRKVIGQARRTGNLTTVVDSVGNGERAAKCSEVLHLVPVPKERVERWTSGTGIHDGVCERVPGHLPAFIDKECAPIRPS
jgi:hypothetical protein